MRLCSASTELILHQHLFQVLEQNFRLLSNDL